MMETTLGPIQGGAKDLGLQFKGAHYGLKMIFPDDITEDALIGIFAEVPGEAYDIPIGRGVVLDFKARPCSERLITRVLREVVWPRKLTVLAWLTSDENASRRLGSAGFRTEEPSPGGASAPKNLIVSHSLRSGHHEEYGGDVILAGHLHEGAELYAGGSVFVFGRLKGLVHAGCSGTEGVCVTAASFEARQLRVGDKLCDQFGADMKWWKKPVIITLEEDGLLFREWARQ